MQEHKKNENEVRSKRKKKGGEQMREEKKQLGQRKRKRNYRHFNHSITNK